MKINLKDRVALVTGSSRGIGLAIARKLAESGAHIVLNAKTESSALETAVKSIEACSVSVQVCIGDVGNVKTAKEAAKTAFSSHRRLDVLVNNAGILDDSLIGMIDEEAINHTLQTNVAGVFHFTQACARLMARNGGGSIVNISSIIGRFGNKGQMVYGASKAAVIGATLSSAKELAPQNIRVNAIAPGYIRTDNTQALQDDPERSTEILKRIPAARWGETADLQGAAVFLASSASNYINGHILAVDGGFLAR